MGFLLPEANRSAAVPTGVTGCSHGACAQASMVVATLPVTRWTREESTGRVGAVQSDCPAKVALTSNAVSPRS